MTCKFLVKGAARRYEPDTEGYEELFSIGGQVQTR